jgi:hypothetical protein
VIQELNYVQAWVRVPLVHPVEEDSCDVDETAVNDDNSGSSNDSISSDSSKQQNEDADAMQVCSKYTNSYDNKSRCASCNVCNAGNMLKQLIRF